ncbi:hypothetical protein AAC387_Pa08g1002 [Persea americana]
MHGGSQDSSNRSKTSYKRKKGLHPMLVRKHPTANLHEDNDMHSSFAHNVHSTDRTPRADYDVDKIDAEAEAPNDTICADVDFTQVYGNSVGVMTGNEHEVTPINKVDPSNAKSDVNFQDTMQSYVVYPPDYPQPLSPEELRERARVMRKSRMR